MRPNTCVTLLVVLALVSIEALPWDLPVFHKKFSSEVSGGTAGDANVRVEVTKQIGTSEHNLVGSATFEGSSNSLLASKLRAKEAALKELFSKVHNGFNLGLQHSPSTEASVPVPEVNGAVAGEVSNNVATNIHTEAAKEIGSPEDNLSGSAVVEANAEGKYESEVSLASKLHAHELALKELIAKVRNGLKVGSKHSSSTKASVAVPEVSGALQGEVSSNVGGNANIHSEAAKETGTPEHNLSGSAVVEANAEGEYESEVSLAAKLHAHELALKELIAKVRNGLKLGSKHSSSTKASVPAPEVSGAVQGEVSSNVGGNANIHSEAAKETGTPDHNLSGSAVVEANAEGKYESDVSLAAKLHAHELALKELIAKVRNGLKLGSKHSSSTKASVPAPEVSGAVQGEVSSNVGGNANIHSEAAKETGTPDHNVSGSAVVEANAEGKYESDVSLAAKLHAHELALKELIAKVRNGLKLGSKHSSSTKASVPAPEVSGAVQGEASSNVGGNANIHSEAAKETGTPDHNLSGSAVVEANAEGKYESDVSLASKLHAHELALKELIAKVRNGLKLGSKHSSSTKASVPAPEVSGAVQGEASSNVGGNANIHSEAAKETGTPDHNLSGSAVVEANAEGKYESDVSLAAKLHAHELALKELIAKVRNGLKLGSKHSSSTKASVPAPEVSGAVQGEASSNVGGNANIHSEAAKETGTPDHNLSGSAVVEANAEGKYESDESLAAKLHAHELALKELIAKVRNGLKLGSKHSSSTKASVPAPEVSGAVQGEVSSNVGGNANIHSEGAKETGTPDHNLSGSAVVEANAEGKYESDVSLAAKLHAHELALKELIAKVRNGLKLGSKHSSSTKASVPAPEVSGAVQGEASSNVGGNANIHSEAAKETGTPDHNLSGSAVVEANAEGKYESDVSLAAKLHAHELALKELIAKVRNGLKLGSKHSSSTKASVPAPEVSGAVQGEVSSNVGGNANIHSEGAKETGTPDHNLSGSAVVEANAEGEYESEVSLAAKLHAHELALKELIAKVRNGLKLGSKHSSSTKASVTSPEVSGAVQGEVSSNVGGNANIHSEAAKETGTPDNNLSGSPVVEANAEGKYESEVSLASKLHAHELALKELIAKVRNGLKPGSKHSSSTKASVPAAEISGAVQGEVSSNVGADANVHSEVAKESSIPEHSSSGLGVAAGNTNGGSLSSGGSIAYNLPGVQGSLTKSITTKLHSNGEANQENTDNGVGVQYNGEMELGGKTNLKLLPDQSKWLTWNRESNWHKGPLSGKTNYGGSIELPSLLG